MRGGFFWAIAASLSIHIIILSGITPFKFKAPPKSKPAEVSFIKIQKPQVVEKEKKEPPFKKVDIKKYNLKKNFFAASKIAPPPSYVFRKQKQIEEKSIDKALFQKPSFSKITFSEKKITFINPHNLKNKSPAYMNYYEKIREEIRKHAYNYYEISTGGKVFVSFTIDQKGNLVNLQLSNSSQSTAYLEDITVKSIKEAVPFPPFPKELSKFKTLTFSLTVYFRSQE